MSDRRMQRLAYEILAREFTATDTGQRDQRVMIDAAGYNDWEVEYFVEDLNKRLRKTRSQTRVRIVYPHGANVPPEGGVLSMMDDILLEIGKRGRKVPAVWRSAPLGVAQASATGGGTVPVVLYGGTVPTQAAPAPPASA